MIIDCISDLHGYYPKLDGGDLLIVAGDLTACDDYHGYLRFNEWMLTNSRLYKKCIVIAGNHDSGLLAGRFNVDMSPKVIYLCDSGTEFEYEEEIEEEHKFKGFIKYTVKRKLKIWGSPWTRNFVGQNPHCKAFGLDTEEELAEKWALIPDDVDILITHSPAFNILDWNTKENPCGSFSLLKKARDLHKLKLFVFGHIHESYGTIDLQKVQGETNLIFTNDPPLSFPIVVNASHVNERYKPVNAPIRITL